MKISLSSLTNTVLALGLVTMLGFSGCNKKLGENEAVNRALKGAPSWVTESNGDLLSATGSAKIKNNNLNFATTQAGAAARVELATQIATRIESKYKEPKKIKEYNFERFTNGISDKGVKITL